MISSGSWVRNGGKGSSVVRDKLKLSLLSELPWLRVRVGETLEVTGDGVSSRMVLCLRCDNPEPGFEDKRVRRGMMGSGRGALFRPWRRKSLQRDSRAERREVVGTNCVDRA